MTRRTLQRVISALLVLAFGLGTLAPGVTAASPVDPELAAKLQMRLDRWRLNHHAPGVAAAVRLPDGSRWIGVSGKAIRGKGSRAVRPSTPFAVASLTKTFMAALVLQLRDEGRLYLGMPISRWLPSFPKADKITVKMLLNHRSGIRDYFGHPRYERLVFGRPKHVWKTREILKLVGPRYCDPGKCYRYSNTNYVLLSSIVRKVTGRTAAAEIRDRFLEPLGLTDTYFQGREPIGKIPAKGYWWLGSRYKGFADGSRKRPNTSAATVAHAAGALVSSVRDISDWQDALLGGELLSDRSMELMLSFHRKSGYGLGMRRAWLDGQLGVGHGGSLRGYVSIMYRLPQEDLDVVILTNLGRTSPQGLADKLTRVALRHLEPKPEPEPEPEPAP
ncbi:MAG: serine hydrolase domain-containing protein [Chloroflexota bacterium]